MKKFIVFTFASLFCLTSLLAQDSTTIINLIPGYSLREIVPNKDARFLNRLLPLAADFVTSPFRSSDSQSFEIQLEKASVFRSKTIYPGYEIAPELENVDLTKIEIIGFRMVIDMWHKETEAGVVGDFTVNEQDVEVSEVILNGASYAVPEDDFIVVNEDLVTSQDGIESQKQVIEVYFETPVLGSEFTELGYWGEVKYYLVGGLTKPEGKWHVFVDSLSTISNMFTARPDVTIDFIYKDIEE